MTNWLSAVEAQCGSEDMTFEAAIVDPRIVPLTYTEGFDMACLQDRYTQNMTPSMTPFY
jgi:hypothetical protein